MAYFKLEFGFGRSKSEGKISDTANLVDEQVALEIPGWDFVNDEAVSYTHLTLPTSARV